MSYSHCSTRHCIIQIPIYKASLLCPPALQITRSSPASSHKYYLPFTMRSSTVLSVLSTLALVSAQTGKLGDAPVVTNNPVGASYYATLPNKESESVRGTVYAVSSPTGKGVDFDITLSGLPAEGGPFLYHIHAAAVPPDGNCTGTLAHLDPYMRGEDPPCDPTQKQTCQVGDLSGKHGKINGTTFSAA